MSPNSRSPFDHPIVTQRYFFPRRDSLRDARLIEVNGHTLRCAHRVVDPAAPTFVHLHGNGEVVADYVSNDGADLPTAVNELGANALFIEYRGYGGSSGVPQLAAMLGDGAAVLDALGLDPARCLVYGRSIGSIYAIELAARSPTLGALVLESGIASVLERIVLRAHPRELGVSMEELRAEASRLFNHEAKLAGYRGPLRVLHTRGDHMVALSHAEQNHAWSGSDDKQLIVYERGDHNSILAYNMPAIFEEVAGVLQTLK